jgi:hypothetical protein
MFGRELKGLWPGSSSWAEIGVKDKNKKWYSIPVPWELHRRKGNLSSPAKKPPDAMRAIRS